MSGWMNRDVWFGDGRLTVHIRWVSSVHIACSGRQLILVSLPAERYAASDAAVVVTKELATRSGFRY